jgi:hypothetical protein
MPKADRLILTALAQHGDRTKAQLAILTGYAVNGGGFNNALSSLRGQAFIADGAGDFAISITGVGKQALGNVDPLPTGRDLLTMWCNRLGKAERSILEALRRNYPVGLVKDSLARMAGYEPGGGGFNNALSRLRTLELIQGKSILLLAQELT